MDTTAFSIGEFVFVTLQGDTERGQVIAIRPGGSGGWLYTVRTGNTDVSVYGKRLSYTI